MQIEKAKLSEVIRCLHEAHIWFPQMSRTKRIEWAWKRAELNARLGTARSFTPISTMYIARTKCN